MGIFNTLFVSSTHHCLSLLIAFNTLFLSRLPLFSSAVDVIHLWWGYISQVTSLSGYYQFPELDIKMPGHDHSLQKLYTIEGLSNPSVVYNWICPVLLKEDCPYEALARIFSTYFKDTSGINTSEDYLNFWVGRPTLLRVRLVHYETSHQKDAFVSTFFCLFLSLKIVTMFVT